MKEQKKQMEEVLCAARSELPAQWLKETAACRLTPDEWLEKMSSVSLSWQTRGKAETDPSYKQLIPYVVLQIPDGSQTACYRRAGSEKRLHDLWSIGIGGHINRKDAPLAATPLDKIIRQGLNRELEEELGYLPEDTSPRFMGIINEDKTDVGQVHIGLVYCLTIHDRHLIREDAELNRFQWIKNENLMQRRLEHWSLLAIELLNKNPA